MTNANTVAGYERYGLRADDDLHAVGDVLPESRIWVDGEPTADYLDGTSALRVTDPATPDVGSLAAYPGRYVYLLGSDRWSHGEDEGDIVLRDARVIAIVGMRD